MITHLYLTKKRKRPKFGDLFVGEEVVKFPKIKFTTSQLIFDYYRTKFCKMFKCIYDCHTSSKNR